MVYVIKVPDKGRCVFATEDYKKGDTIEVCEYIRIPKEQIDSLKKTVINDYWFGINGDFAGILLGNGSLYNHRKNGNMKLIEDKDYNIGFVAIRDIKKFEELTRDYGYITKFKPKPPLFIEIQKNESKTEVRQDNGGNGG